MQVKIINKTKNSHAVEIVKIVVSVIWSVGKKQALDFFGSNLWFILLPEFRIYFFSLDDYTRR